jgi:hypothetical protein
VARVSVGVQGAQPEDLPPEMLQRIACLMQGEDGVLVQVGQVHPACRAAWLHVACVADSSHPSQDSHPAVLAPGTMEDAACRAYCGTLCSVGMDATQCGGPCACQQLLTVPVLLPLLQAYLRAGCVHLTYEALQTQQQVQEGLPWEQLAAALGPDLLAPRAVLLQQGKQATVLASGGKAKATWAVDQPSGPAKLTAQLHSVEPCCVVVGQAADVMLVGSDLSAPGIKLHARFQGHFLQVGAVQQQQEDSAQLLAMPAVTAPGRVALELEQQLLLSEPLQLLVVPEQQMADEVQRLQRSLAAQQAEQLLQDLGVLLDYSSVCSRQQRQWGRREEHAMHDSAGSQMSSRDNSRRNSSETAAAAELANDGTDELEQQQQEEEVEAAESSSCMSDDSAQELSEEEEVQLHSGQHPWLSARWDRLVQRTGSRLLLLAAAHGCTATAGWLLQLLEEVAPGRLDLTQVRKGLQHTCRLPL